MADKSKTTTNMSAEDYENIKRRWNECVEAFSRAHDNEEAVMTGQPKGIIKLRGWN